MHVLRLKISDKVFDKLLWLLNKFSKDEIEIIEEDAEFKEHQKYLQGEYDEILNEQARFVTLQEAEERLEKVIKKHEGRS